MNHPKMRVNKEQAVALDYLHRITNGFHHEMYCIMNRYLFNPNTSQIVPELEVIRGSNLFHLVDAMRYGYEVL